MINRRQLAFLTASFASALGDTLLVFAVPTGLGLATADLRSAVLMWLIPAVAIFISTALAEKIVARTQSARNDYSRLLIATGILEIAVAILAYIFTAKTQTVILISVFVFFYALAKEGIPRLLYNVAVFRYFATTEEYTRLAGLNSGLGIAAALLGTLFASVLVTSGNWKIALLLDAATFVILGAAVLWYGRDFNEPSAAPDGSASSSTPLLTASLRAIMLGVPLIFGINALCWNYLPLISQKLTGTAVGTSLALIAFLRLPGMIAGFQTKLISRYVSFQTLVSILPLSVLLTSVGFLLVPGIGALCLLIIVQGIVAGIYWPADYSIRMQLPASQLIRFNAMTVRRFAAVQFVACLLAVVVYEPSASRFDFLLYAMLAIFAISALAAFSRGKRKIVRTISMASITVVMSSCIPRNEASVVQVHTFSISTDMRLSTDLTFSAINVINDTSAHFLRIAPSLTLKGDLVEKYETPDNGKTYKLIISKTLSSARGDTFTAADVEYTIKKYLTEFPKLAGPFSALAGADQCSKSACRLEGYSALADNVVQLVLKTPDLRFIEKLSSPWLVIFKAGKPLFESVGDCTVPYQTGNALLSDCNKSRLTLVKGLTTFVITDNGEVIKGAEQRYLQSVSTGAKAVPTLTSLSVFANPGSALSKEVRAAVMSNIRSNAALLAADLHLRPSQLFVSGWLAVPVPETIKNLKVQKPITCPKSPIKVLLDTSLPDGERIKAYLTEKIGCELAFTTTKADSYFSEFRKTDLGVAWFTPDFLDVANVFGPFDCEPGASCYFNWKDKELSSLLRKVKTASEDGKQDLQSSSEIEALFLKNGYVAPLAEMNWWIKSESKVVSIHPAGLFQVRISDFGTL